MLYTMLAAACAVISLLLVLLYKSKTSRLANNSADGDHLADDILNNIGMPVMMIDKEFNIKSLNIAGASLGGKAVSSYIGTKCYDLFKTDHCRTEHCALRQAMEQDRIIAARTEARPNADTTIPILYSGAPYKNEDGEIIGAIEYVQEISHIVRTQKEVQDGSVQLSAAVEEMSALSQQVGTRTGDMARQTGEVAVATEQMSGNFGSVSAAVEQTHGIFHTIATATEEMSATIDEIARNTTQANDMTRQAVEQSEDLGKRVTDLNKASEEVSSIVGTIISISEQTKLLALNATIEAARAGEYGKGFAVVANEVKELARQTSDAIVDIQNKVGNISETTQTTASDIMEIGSAIGDISHTVTSISTALEEQNVTTREITQNINEAVQGMNEVTRNVSEASTAAQAITDKVMGVNEGISEVDQATTHLGGASDELARLSKGLEVTAQRLSE